MTVRQIKCECCGASILRRLRGDAPVDAMCWLCAQEQEVAEPMLDLDALGEPGPISPPLPDADQLAAGMAQTEPVDECQAIRRAEAALHLDEETGLLS